MRMYCLGRSSVVRYAISSTEDRSAQTEVEGGPGQVGSSAVLLFHLWKESKQTVIGLGNRIKLVEPRPKR